MPVLRDLMIALSMANLWFIDLWQLFLVRHASAYPYYHWKLNPAPLIMATMLDVLVVAGLLFAGVILIRRSQSRILKAAARVTFVILVFLLLVNLPLKMLLNPAEVLVLFRWQGSTTIISWLAVLVLASSWMVIVALIHSLIFHRERVLKISTTVLQITAPMILVTFGQASAQWFNYRLGNEFQASSAPYISNSSVSSRRVLWIVFDEMDLNLSFLGRPEGTSLPAFDRLRNESLFAENAYPPAGDTVLSLPALTTGQFVSRAERTAPNELMLTFGDTDNAVKWSTQPNVFSKAREQNLNTGMVGWFHPYCRILGSSLTTCSWETSRSWFLGQTEVTELISDSEHASLPTAMLGAARSLTFPQLVHILLPRDRGNLWKRHSIREFENIHRRALAIAADPNLQLILLHYPIPHPPGIYDRNANEFSTAKSTTYEDNLVLADRVLKEQRERLELTGLWDNTTIIVSSDHSLRSDRVWRTHPLLKWLHTTIDPVVLESVKDARVPFIVKLSGQATPLGYGRALNTVLTPHLILAVLRGEISTTPQAASWLDSHPSIGESPYEDGEQLGSGR